VTGCGAEYVSARFDMGMSAGWLALCSGRDSRERPPVRFDHGCRIQISPERKAAVLQIFNS